MKKQFIVAKRLHLATARLSKDQRNQVIGVLKAGSTVNDIMRQSGCSRQAIPVQQNWEWQSSCKTWSRKFSDVTSLSR